MSESLLVHEIYLSLQGESTWAGLPCVFVRLTGCHLRCSYCDTAYAFQGGERQLVGEVLERVEAWARPYGGDGGRRRLPLVELTGGEPLLQAGSLELMAALCDRDYTVLLETSGALDIRGVDPRVHRIMDLKCPSSGESGRNLWANLDELRPSDELKFVVATDQDYQWMADALQKHALAERCPVLVSWAGPLTEAQRAASLHPAPGPQERLSLRALAERLVADHLPVRFQVQMHKVIWPADQRGV